jgi:oligopeptidase B
MFRLFLTTIVLSLSATTYFFFLSQKGDAPMTTSTAKGSPAEPIALKKEKVLEIHGDKRIDPYFWMNERDSKPVLSYLKEENNYLETILSSKKSLRNELFEEMKARTVKKDSSVPYKEGSYYYYSRMEEESNHPLYCRKKDSLESLEEIILNTDELAKNYSYFDLGDVEVSPSERLLAYSQDTQSRRIFSISIKNLLTGTTEDNVISGASGDFIWSSDSKTLYYNKRDLNTLRSCELWSYDLETKKHKNLFLEEDTTFSIHLAKSRSKRYLFLLSNSTLTTEVSFLDLTNKDASLKVFSPRKRGVEYEIEDGGDRFYILTNLKNKNFSLMETTLEKTSLENWKEVLSVEPEVFLKDIEVFESFVALRESHEGLLKIKLLDRKTNKTRYLPTKEEPYKISFSMNPNYSGKTIRYSYESMTTPYSILEYDLTNKETKVLKTKEVLGDFSSENYVSKRVFATARDGALIPISIAHRKDLKITNKTPLLQYGYGAYGITIDPSFSSERLSLLDRGFVYAISHIRGSSYKGRAWYESGKMSQKKNTFYDFIDCSKFLISEGYTSKEHLYAMGGSAGGLLMGAVTNMTPELYRGVVAIVPFVDVLTSMLDDTIPLTTFEYDEWGNPNKKDEYDYMKSYSPYDNVTEQEYPNLLVITGYHDSQVQYWEPAKWVAKLRDKRKGNNLLLFYTDLNAGHSGASGRFDHLKDIALYYSFLLHLEGHS